MARACCIDLVAPDVGLKVKHSFQNMEGHSKNKAEVMKIAAVFEHLC